MMIHHNYTFLEKIGSGMFGSIYKGQNQRTQEYVAIKVEPISCQLKLLVHESKIYHYLHGCKGIPTIKWFGKDTVNYYMVINLLGESLLDTFMRVGTFSLSSTFKIGIHLLQILQTIHDKGLVHRDIKPDNFLFGDNTHTQLYLIDFGFCKSYRDTHNHHIPMKSISGIIGSISFCSLAVHHRQEISRKDDLESLCYVLWYLHTGKLPWLHDTDEQMVLFKKKELSTCPHAFFHLIHYIRTIPFQETPNYSYLIQLFSSP